MDELTNLIKDDERLKEIEKLESQIKELKVRFDKNMEKYNELKKSIS